MEDDSNLTGHCTMLIDGECYTFPLPVFHDSRVSGWGPGRVGEFWQEGSPEMAVEFYRQQKLHDRTLRRFGWVRKIAIPLPVRFHLGFDEDDGEDLGHAWGRTTLGKVLARRLVVPAPMARGNHLVTGNIAESCVLMHTFNVTVADMVWTGAGL